MKLRPVFLALLFLVGAAANAGATDKKPPAIAIEQFGPAPGWQGPQKVQADKKGHVFLLRAETLEVYPVGKGGALGEPTKLQASTSIDAPVLDAAMGPGGPGDWLLRLPHEVRWFVDGKEKPLPRLEWRPWGVGFVRSTPVVSVLPLPAPANGIAVINHGEKGPPKAPAVMALDGDRWSTLVEASWPAQRDTNSLTENLALTLLGDHEGKLWAAHDYAYVLERFSAAGRSLGRFMVEKGRIEHQEASAVAIPKAVRQEDRPHFRPFLGVMKISALTEGLDHRIYVLVQAGQGDKGVSLDRFDPAQSVLERVSLGVNLEGMVTLAAGRDGLYLAGHAGDQGRWRVSWEALDQADWKSVEMEGTSAPVKK